MCKSPLFGHDRIAGHGSQPIPTGLSGYINSLSLNKGVNMPLNIRASSHSCEYYINKLAVESAKIGKVKKTSLLKCLKQVRNSDIKSVNENCDRRINKLETQILCSQSKIKQAKIDLLTSIYNNSVNTGNILNAYQKHFLAKGFHCQREGQRILISHREDSNPTTEDRSKDKPTFISTLPEAWIGTHGHGA